MKHAIITVLAGLLASHATAALIAPDGRPYTHIVVAEDAPSSVKLAATDMQQLLKRMTGTELPIVHETAERPVICIGDQPLLKAAGLTTEGPANEQWKCLTTNDLLAIYGDDYKGAPVDGTFGGPWSLDGTYSDNLKVSIIGATGSMTGVYEFLHRVVGFRFYMPGEDGTVVPETPEFKVPPLNLGGAPAVPWRHIYFCRLAKGDESMMWAKRMNFGGDKLVEIVHLFWFMMKHKDTHPEYFALVDGKRDFSNLCNMDGSGHLCLTNPDLIEQYAKDICKWFDDNPMIDVFPCAPGDGLKRICGCPNCQAELHADYPEEEQFSYHIWNFVQKVAAKVAETHPTKYVGCLAYEKYRTPPRELGPMKNVAVMITNGRSTTANPQYRKQIHDEIDAWAKRVDRFYLWSWYLDHWPPTNNLPVAQFHVIQNEIRWLLSHPNYMGEYIESEPYHPRMGAFQGRMEYPGLQHFGLYLTGRMYMDPTTDADALLKEYCRLFYGPAGDAMLAFWTEAQTQREAILAEKRSPEAEDIFTADILKALQVHMDAALAATVEDSVHRRRVALIKDEFDIGHTRMRQLLGIGRRKEKLVPVKNFLDVQQLNEEIFVGKDGGQPGTPRTTIRYGRDRSALFVRFVCYEPDVNRILADVTEPDNGHIWKDDSVDIFLYPDAENFSKGYHIIVNTRRVVYDATTTKDSLQEDTSWTCHPYLGFRHEKGYWIMDISIPFKDIGIEDPDFAGPIAANFYRNRFRDGAMGCSCWNPTNTNIYNVPEKFGRLNPKWD